MPPEPPPGVPRPGNPLVVQREPCATIRDGAFRIDRMRPGRMLGKGDDGVLGPLSVVDRARIGAGTVIAMHEHRDDEILSYILRGTLTHRDSAGNCVTLSSDRLMIMNAGTGLHHEEVVADEPVDMLQIFVRPEAAGLEPAVCFHDRAVNAIGCWNLIAGPHGSGAPLIVRNAVTVLDAAAARGTILAPPHQPGRATWLYVMEGRVGAAAYRIGEGQALGTGSGALPDMMVEEDPLVIAFLGCEPINQRS